MALHSELDRTKLILHICRFDMTEAWAPHAVRCVPRWKPTATPPALKYAKLVRTVSFECNIQKEDISGYYYRVHFNHIFMERVETFLHHIWGLKSSTPALGPLEFAALVGTTENSEFCDFIFTTYEPIPDHIYIYIAQCCK